MAKRAQQESGEERVTAKSRPMMNLTARMPSFVSSSASSNPGRTSYGYQDPERYVLDDRMGEPVEMSRSDYLQKDYGLNWTRACDKRLNRLISYIHHTCEYKQYCHVGNTAKQCRLGLFQDSDFAGDIEDKFNITRTL